MPIQLDPDGFLPPGAHPAEEDEVLRLFVTGRSDEARRRELFDRWLAHRTVLSAMLPIVVQWLNGSFVTPKIDPGDIDVVTVAAEEDYLALPPQYQYVVRMLTAGHSTRDVLGVDSFLVLERPTTHPGYANYLTLVRGWKALWGRVRGQPSRVKGFLEVRP